MGIGAGVRTSAGAVFVLQLLRHENDCTPLDLVAQRREHTVLCGMDRDALRDELILRGLPTGRPASPLDIIRAQVAAEAALAMLPAATAPAPERPSREPKAPTRRGEYFGDLAAYMARLKPGPLGRMADDDVVRKYLDDHKKRAGVGESVPRLPATSNRLTRMADRVKRIRSEMPLTSEEQGKVE